MSPSQCPAIVLLPAEDLDSLAITLESVAVTVPTAAVHVVRAGIPALDAITDMLTAAGLSTIDVPALDGFPAVIAALDDVFGGESWTYLFAGERLSASDGGILDGGGQLVSRANFPWLQVPSPIEAPRVRAGGHAVRARQTAVLRTPRLPASWSLCLLQDVRAGCASAREVYEDVALLTHAGQYDAAFQRAERAWADAPEAEQLLLARAATVLASMIGVTRAALGAAAAWFGLEPVPWAALCYVRIAVGCVPYELADRLMAVVPLDEPVDYRDGLHVEPLEHVEALRTIVAKERLLATSRLDLVLRSLADGIVVDRDVATALGCAALIGAPPAVIVNALPDAVALTFTEIANVALDPTFGAQLVAALAARFGSDVLLERLTERFVTTNGREAAVALDRAGLTGGDHWAIVERLERSTGATSAVAA